MAGKYDANFQETSLLNLAYKGLYLMQAMGQFTKDNALRDDISVRMSQLGNKIDISNPSEVNQGVMDAIGKLAMDKDGNFVDEKVVKPYYEATKTYFDAIQPMTLRKEKFDKDFFLANDLVLNSMKKGEAGYYDGDESTKALLNLSAGLAKNANFFTAKQKASYQDILKKNRDAMDVISYLEKNDMDKKLSGVQIDMQNLDKSYAFEGETTQDIFNNAALLVEQGNYEKAKEVLADLENRDILRNRKSDNAAELVKGVEATLNESQSGALKGEDGKEYLKDPALNRFLTSDAKISETFFSKNNFKQPENWKNLYNSKLSALDGLVKKVTDSGPGQIYGAEDILTDASKLQEFLDDLSGEGLFTGEDFTNSAKLVNVVQNYIRYLKTLDNSYNSIFGERLLKPPVGRGIATNPNIEF